MNVHMMCIHRIPRESSVISYPLRPAETPGSASPDSRLGSSFESSSQSLSPVGIGSSSSAFFRFLDALGDAQKVSRSPQVKGANPLSISINLVGCSISQSSRIVSVLSRMLRSGLEMIRLLSCNASSCAQGIVISLRYFCAFG